MFTTRRDVVAGGTLMTSAVFGAASALSLSTPEAAVAQTSRTSSDFDYQLAYQRGIEAVL